MYDIVRVH